MNDGIVVWDGIGNPSNTWTPGRMHAPACQCWFHLRAVERCPQADAWAKKLRPYFNRKPGTSPYEQFQRALKRAAV